MQNLIFAMSSNDDVAWAEVTIYPIGCIRIATVIQ